MATGIRSYGPGKFYKLIDSYAYEVTLDGGPDEETGSVDEGGWYGFLNLNSATKENIRAVAAEEDDVLTEWEDDQLIESQAIIFHERTDGIVEADWFKSLKDAETQWAEIEEEFNEEDEFEDEEGDDE
jgi:hypothetical protein